MNAKKHNSMAWKRFSVYIPIQLEISIGLEQRPDIIKSDSTLKERITQIKEHGRYFTYTMLHGVQVKQILLTRL